MSKPTYRMTVQALSALCVTASRLFVGFEIKQPRHIAIAEMYQERTGMWNEIVATQFSAEQCRELIEKLYDTSTSLTDFEVELPHFAIGPLSEW